jgi:hypothetical protein
MIRPGKEAKVINFDSLRGILLSDDLSRDSELPDTSGKFCQFLDGAPIKGNQVAFCSYPRSGNSFLRGYLEKVCSVFTGSDLPGVPFLNSGLLGEGTNSDSGYVWITKTHFPLMVNSY